MSKISIIIPTINEANNLPLLLSDLSSIQKEGEIIIVDSGSEDKTIDIANIYGAKVFISKERNRGLQLDIGARNSKGDWLIFLHADTRLTHDWFKKINSFLKGNKNIIYYFEFKINHKKIIYRVLEILVNFRSKFFISSRKWERTNIFLQAIKNWNFRRRWLKGESLKSIYSDYYKK